MFVLQQASMKNFYIVRFACTKTPQTLMFMLQQRSMKNFYVVKFACTKTMFWGVFLCSKYFMVFFYKLNAIMLIKLLMVSAMYSGLFNKTSMHLRSFVRYKLCGFASKFYLLLTAMFVCIDKNVIRFVVPSYLIYVWLMVAESWFRWTAATYRW